MTRPRILVVDDDDDIRRAILDVLVFEGYDVAEAANGRDALEAMRLGPLPDLVLLDLMMPTMDGWEFRAVQRDDPALRGVPVVLLTATSREGLGALAAAEYVRKPTSLVDLLAIVRRIAGAVEPASAHAT